MTTVEITGELAAALVDAGAAQVAGRSKPFPYTEPSWQTLHDASAQVYADEHDRSKVFLDLNGVTRRSLDPVDAVVLGNYLIRTAAEVEIAARMRGDRG